MIFKENFPRFCFKDKTIFDTNFKNVFKLLYQLYVKEDEENY